MLKVDPLWLSPGEANDTLTYLSGLADTSNTGATIHSLFARCHLATLWRSGVNLNDLGEEAGRLCARLLTDQHAAPANLDPLLLIEIYRILKQEGIDVAMVGGVLERMAVELAAQPPETLRIGRLRLIASQLASLGVAVRPAGASKQMLALLNSPEKWFVASAGELGEIVDHLLANQQQLGEIPIEILSIIALAELRNYRVDLGCALLRAVFQLGKPCAAAIEALNFIALQRRRDGRYGFAHRFGEALEPDDQQHLNLYLPLTANAIWLFAVAHRCQGDVARSS